MAGNPRPYLLIGTRHQGELVISEQDRVSKHVRLTPALTACIPIYKSIPRIRTGERPCRVRNPPILATLLTDMFLKPMIVMGLARHTQRL